MVIVLCGSTDAAFCQVHQSTRLRRSNRYAWPPLAVTVPGTISRQGSSVKLVCDEAKSDRKLTLSWESIAHRSPRSENHRQFSATFMQLACFYLPQPRVPESDRIYVFARLERLVQRSSSFGQRSVLIGEKQNSVARGGSAPSNHPQSVGSLHLAILSLGENPYRPIRAQLQDARNPLPDVILL